MMMGDGMGKLIGDWALPDFISETSPFQAGLASEQVAMRTACREALVRAGWIYCVLNTYNVTFGSPTPPVCSPEEEGSP